MPDGQPLLSGASPRATTSVLGVIGDPVHRSLSPALHNAGLRAMGLDWVYVAFPVAAADGHRAVDAARVLGIIGLSVTMPHKRAVAAAVDRLGPTAQRLGAVNTVIAHGAEMVGESTDGPGLIDALRDEEDWDPGGGRCVVLGTGGAARAVALALAEAGAVEVVVVGRDPEAAAATAALAGGAGRVGSVAEVATADLVVNATPVGMTVGADLPLGLDPARLGAGQRVVDLVYAPAETALLAAAAGRGCQVANGFGMLLHQAGRQLAAWTGQPAPLAEMAAAGRAALVAAP